MDDDNERPGDERLNVLCENAIRVAKAAPGAVTRVRIRHDGSTVELGWAAPDGTVSAMAPAPVAAAFAVTTADPAEPGQLGDTNVGYVCAPMVGTFYRSPAPDAPPFVQVGDVIDIGAQVGIVEAMKLMNPVEADRACRVVEVLVGDGVPVEYDQRLVAVAPLDAE